MSLLYVWVFVIRIKFGGISSKIKFHLHVSVRNSIVSRWMDSHFTFILLMGYFTIPTTLWMYVSNWRVKINRLPKEIEAIHFWRYFFIFSLVFPMYPINNVTLLNVQCLFAVKLRFQHDLNFIDDWVLRI